MNYFGLKHTLDYVGYFETEEQTNLFKELKPQIRQAFNPLVRAYQPSQLNRRIARDFEVDD